MRSTEVRRMASQALEELSMALEDGHSESLKAFLKMLARFHRYSAGNVLLIALQHPDATQVAGYRTWQRMGRQVKKRERSIRILAPVVWRKRSEQRGDEEDEEEERLLAFKPANVFDVSQTEGKPLPEFERAEGDPGEYLQRLEAFIAGKGIVLKETVAIGSAIGASAGGRIYLRPGLEPAEAFSTLVHELAHEMLHHGDSEEKDKIVRETEAEAVAYVVSEAIGLQAKHASTDYVHLHGGDKGTLLTSLERIRQTAVEIIQGVRGSVDEDGSISEVSHETAQAAA
jgi:antirestriction protein ArdC